MKLFEHPDFAQAILQAAERFREQGLRPSIIEKDYYVTEALRIIAEGTAAATGDAFFRTLVEHLARAIGTHHAFVARFVPPGGIGTLAYWSHGKLVPNIEYALEGTPCAEVIHGGLCFYPRGLEEKYAEAEPGIQSYLGVPLIASDGRILGHLCAFDESPMADQPRTLAVFKIFAARAAAELGRLDLERELRDKEDQLRDLFDEAPIAYVHETLDSRFLRANRAARRILGITPEDVPHMVGKDMVPDTPDAQRRMHEAFESVGTGTDTSGVVLELRRKDTGNPIWIQWWSNPDRSGSYTRTMFIDITERVLLEQEQARLKAQNLYLQEELKAVHNFEEIVGASAGLVKVLENVRRVAPTDATVLITGESGTGKELIARAIHSASKRADKPFIKVNCAALAVSLIESELFGHERGAFSGAIQRRVGRFELAHTGTIFLDEIGEVPPDVQVKLLRVLQEREFERVGGTNSIKVDIRLIAATNCNLEQAVREGRFRQDLYYRLAVLKITMPTLRDRQEDIPMLVRHFVQKHAKRCKVKPRPISREALSRLVNYDWPGNVRELENAIERALVLGSSDMILPEDLPESLLERTPRPEMTEAKYHTALKELKKQLILEAVEQTHSYADAARILGVHPNYLHRLIRNLEMKECLKEALRDFPGRGFGGISGGNA